MGSVHFSLKTYRTTNEIEGVSFRYNDIAFKGSEIDRKFSFGNLQKAFKENIKVQQEQFIKAQEQQEKPASKVQTQTESKPKTPTIGGVQLTAEQWQTLKKRSHIYLKNMNRSDGKSKFSSYVFLNKEQMKAYFSQQNPDAFVKYRKYEMRLRDKILIEKGFVTKAKIKWYGIGNYAYPYLIQKDEVKRQTISNKIKKNRGKRM